MSNRRLEPPYTGIYLLDDLDYVTHAVTTRFGPAFGQVGTDQATAEAAAETAIELHMRGTAWTHQVHGNTILRGSEPGLVGQADGLVSDSPGLLLAGRSADCPIILIAGKRADESAAVGYAHASWRSTIQGISGLLVQRLVGEMECLPHSLHVGISASAGPCCYEVGEEVRNQALENLGPQACEFFIQRNQRLFFDLWAANTAQLIDFGVLPSQIDKNRICTICDGDNFWSWRRQGHKAGRFAAVIGIYDSRPQQLAGV